MSLPVDMEQHFLADLGEIRAVASLAFRGRHVIEFGAGTGALTGFLLGAGAASVEAWELDPALGEPFQDPRLSWRCRDILHAVRDDVDGRVIASFPPYSTLPFLLDLCAEASDLLLMVPGRMLDRCAGMGMRIVAEVPGSAFTPPSGGRHHVVARGL